MPRRFADCPSLAKYIRYATVTHYSVILASRARY
jgi:hypothetical protein